MILLDATALLLLIEPSAKPPKDPATGKPLEKCRERIEHLLLTLSEAAVQVVLPTPVLAEVLVRAGAARNQYLTELTTNHAFRPASFDERAAVELSMILDGDAKSKKKLGDKQTWAKLKFDRQIIALRRCTRSRRFTPMTPIWPSVHAITMSMSYTPGSYLCRLSQPNRNFL